MSITSAFSADPFRCRSFRRSRTDLRILEDLGPATSGRGLLRYAALCLFLCSLLVAFDPGLLLSQSAVGTGFSSLQKTQATLVFARKSEPSLHEKKNRDDDVTQRFVCVIMFEDISYLYCWQKLHFDCIVDISVLDVLSTHCASPPPCEKRRSVYPRKCLPLINHETKMKFSWKVGECDGTRSILTFT